MPEDFTKDAKISQFQFKLCQKLANYSDFTFQALLGILLVFPIPSLSKGIITGIVYHEMEGHKIQMWLRKRALRRAEDSTDRVFMGLSNPLLFADEIQRSIL
jgi:hypothetical protein